MKNIVVFLVAFATLVYGPYVVHSQEAAEATNQGLPPSSTFQPPAQNACQSKYDQFYEAEPGVYAYWALCETGNPIQVYDYVSQFDLTHESHAWGSGVVSGGSEGPVADGESAASVTTASTNIQNQGMLLNSHQGTLSIWINADAQAYPVTALWIAAVSGKSSASISVNAGAGLCFNGSYVGSAGTATKLQKCGYAVNTWHRVSLTWLGGKLTLYVDGAPVTNGQYTEALDNKVFYYRLFPGCCNTGKQMTLAKVSVANQSWSDEVEAADFAPVFVKVPKDGVYLSSQPLGTIHRDVLGFADRNQNIATPEVRGALLSGLRAAGVTAVRHGGGYGGIETDLANWRGGVTCTKTPGATKKAQNLTTSNTLDNYFEEVVQKLHLDAVYSVNYGTNPPDCNAGGDPIANGSDLVEYANRTKKYGIKYWEIGNEVYSPNSETDFHSGPGTGASYAQYEPEFYKAMKAKDPSIKIAVPIGPALFTYENGFNIPTLSAGSYDAIVLHSYPMRDPITDGATLYPDRVASNMHRVRGSLLRLQTELMNYGRSPDAIWVTEWNAEVGGGKWSKQTMGAAMPLFAASQLAEFMQAGVQIATWWTQATPNGCSTFNYDGNGESTYSWWECGATGLVYAGPTVGMGEKPIGLKPGDLTPVGRAFQLLSESGFVTEGEHMLRTQTDLQGAPWLMSYAATHGASRAMLLINRDRDTSHTVPITIAGLKSGSSVQQWSYGRKQYDDSRDGNWSTPPVHSVQGNWTGSVRVTLPPWSVSVVLIGK